MSPIAGLTRLAACMRVCQAGQTKCRQRIQSIKHQGVMRLVLSDQTLAEEGVSDDTNQSGKLPRATAKNLRNVGRDSLNNKKLLWHTTCCTLKSFNRC